MIVTITFDEKDGKTTLTIHTLFASVAMKNSHVGGFGRASARASISSGVVAEMGGKRPSCEIDHSLRCSWSAYRGDLLAGNLI